MPQFDLAFYLSQAFWMIVSFGFLYLMMSYLICPMIEEVLSERNRLIKEDLDAAEGFNRQAEALVQRHQAFILASEQEKETRIQNAYARIQKQAMAAENRNEQILRRKVRQTEERLSAANATLRQESEQAAMVIAQELKGHLFEVYGVKGES